MSIDFPKMKNSQKKKKTEKRTQPKELTSNESINISFSFAIVVVSGLFSLVRYVEHTHTVFGQQYRTCERTLQRNQHLFGIVVAEHFVRFVLCQQRARAHVSAMF